MPGPRDDRVRPRRKADRRRPATRTMKRTTGKVRATQPKAGRPGQSKAGTRKRGKLTVTWEDGSSETFQNSDEFREFTRQYFGEELELPGQDARGLRSPLPQVNLPAPGSPFEPGFPGMGQMPPQLAGNTMFATQPRRPMPPPIGPGIGPNMPLPQGPGNFAPVPQYGSMDLGPWQALMQRGSMAPPMGQPPGTFGAPDPEPEPEPTPGPFYPVPEGLPGPRPTPGPAPEPRREPQRPWWLDPTPIGGPVGREPMVPLPTPDPYEPLEYFPPPVQPTAPSLPWEDTHWQANNSRAGAPYPATA
jgi:hypothetical protein